jgi:nucleotide-binding universal stress UspA family protein
MNSPLRSVLVPLDGSPLSEQALPVGAALARAAGATLHLATVKPPVSTVAGPPDGFGAGATAEGTLHEGMRAYLEQQADSVRAHAPMATVTCTVLDGPTARSLAACIRALEVDLVVMTTHGWGGIKRLWLGSVADELLRRERSPVLLLRPVRTQQTIGFHRVLVALDGRTECESVLEAAVAVGALFPGAHYTLVEVLDPLPRKVMRMLGRQDRNRPAWVEYHRAAMSDRLAHLGRDLRRRGFKADERALVGQGVAEQILDLARHTGSDLLVIGTRTPHEVERLVVGSVADKIVRGASQPVLVVPLAPSARKKPEHATAVLTAGG